MHINTTLCSYEYAQTIFKWNIIFPQTKLNKILLFALIRMKLPPIITLVSKDYIV